MSGDGSVFQRASDNKWIAQLSIGSRTSRRYVSRSANTKREAQSKLRELQAEHRAGVARGPLTAGSYLAQWVRDVRNIRPTTRHGYEVVVNHHLVPVLGHVRLVELSPLHVEAALSDLGKRMSAKSVRNIHTVLRRALGQAVRLGLVTRNVASREFVDAPRVPFNEPRVLSVDEVHRLLATAADDRLLALFVVAVGTGLRQGELLGLAWEDLDLANARLTVRRELVYRDGKYRREEPKTDRSRRVVPLAQPIIAALEEHRARVIAEGFVPTSTGPVFTNRRGGPLSGSWVTHHFYQLLTEAGIPRLPFKNLRTTFASRLHEMGVADRVIADILGHTRTRTTQTHYIATSPESAVAAVARLVR